ncbi:aminotransferase [Propionigenium maris DSM 9537]|uniref:cysteine-S-conjugate beta-lyase n=1 Tax=Propionigenium maris DSM 9537 TaxID=1123000 RepID=A0A9W6GLT9_9FUSO|nr:aminotransferase class I/II-fold pyridoxal phosphate-dependent enzyme [Propionigenium maris]GLI56773.1 aminotransferase [Propionigenium maris DSM 9537]
MNFDKVVDRRGTYCTQWDYIEDRFGEGSGDLIPFTISDMDFESPKEIVEELATRVDHRVFGYSRWNHTEYKGSVRGWYGSRCGAEVEESWVAYSPSVLYSVSLLLEMILGKGGKLMTHTPRYDGLTKLVKPYELYEVELKEGEKGRFETDFERIEEGFREGAKAFLLCNPQNPTGKVWSRKELQRLVDLCKRYGAYLISDEIHMDVTRREFTSVLNVDTSVSIVASSPSKTFNIPALGGSYVIIPQRRIREEFVEHTRSIDGVSTASIFGVLGTIAAYNRCEYWLDGLNDYINENLREVAEELDGYRGLEVYIPEATYLMWIDFKGTGLEPEEFQKLLIERGRVAIMSGELYGDPYRIRLNVGCSREKLRRGIEGIKKALDTKK